MTDQQIHGRMPGTIDAQIEMAERQIAAGDESAHIDLDLLQQLRDGKITPEEMNRQRVEALEALKV